MFIADIARRLQQRMPKVVSVDEAQRQKSYKEGESGRALAMRSRCRIVERTVGTLEGPTHLADV